MARQTKPLSVTAKPKEADYVLYDGDGLELLIKSSGSKIWQFRYIRPVTKKRAKMLKEHLTPLEEQSILKTLRRVISRPNEIFRFAISE
ncbi:TPA: hypothetical protein MYO83_004649 [Klebsiella michiganensis]|nr:hypothetical protein [Klebsiella michiganensis]HCB1848023.1 hypothetical protein [Klebsiella oxytoca]